jgi:DNA invertase Pin-like site-specific DNA recombinase
LTSKNTPLRVVIYCRISRDRTGAGLGVAQQEAECRQLAARLGFEVTEVYADNDLSAFKGSGRAKPRPGYNDLLDDIKSGRFGAVVVWHTDRLLRDMTELEGYISVCGGDNGIPTHAVRSSDLDLTTASGRMVARILGAVAQQEVEHMIERQKSAKRRRREAGLRCSGARPFGYQLDHNAATGLVIDPAEAAAIRSGYESVLAGIPYNTIARQWTQAGLRTPVRGYRRGEDGEPTGKLIGGRPWNGLEVKRLLLCARNAGIVEHDAGDGRGPQIVGPAKWEPIVSQDTWRAARDIMLARTGPNTISPGPQPRWWLKGTLICGVCGCRRFRVVAKGSAFAYQCASMLEDRTAPTAGWHLHRNARLLEGFIENVIVGRLSRPDVVAALNTRPSVDIPALDTRRAAINAELEEIAAARFTVRQKATMSAPLLDELEQVEQQISEGLRGDPLPEFTGNDPAKVWAALKEAGNVERMRAVAALLLRVRLLPTGRIGRAPFPEDSVEIIWQAPDA